MSSDGSDYGKHLSLSVSSYSLLIILWSLPARDTTKESENEKMQYNRIFPFCVAVNPDDTLPSKVPRSDGKQNMISYLVWHRVIWSIHTDYISVNADGIHWKNMEMEVRHDQGMWIGIWFVDLELQITPLNLYVEDIYGNIYCPNRCSYIGWLNITISESHEIYYFWRQTIYSNHRHLINRQFLQHMGQINQ